MGNQRRPHARRSGRHPVRPPRQATGPPWGGPDTPRRCAGGAGGPFGLPQPPRPAARRRPRQAAQQTRHGGPRKPRRICEQGRRRQPPTGPHTADVLTRHSAAKQAGGDGGTAARPPDLAAGLTRGERGRGGPECPPSRRPPEGPASRNRHAGEAAPGPRDGLPDHPVTALRRVGAASPVPCRPAQGAPKRERGPASTQKETVPALAIPERSLWRRFRVNPLQC